MTHFYIFKLRKLISWEYSLKSITISCIWLWSLISLSVYDRESTTKSLSCITNRTKWHPAASRQMTLSDVHIPTVWSITELLLADHNKVILPSVVIHEIWHSIYIYNALYIWQWCPLQSHIMAILLALLCTALLMLLILQRFANNVKSNLRAKDHQWPSDHIYDHIKRQR